jgi:hypothetical protein
MERRRVQKLIREAEFVLQVDVEEVLGEPGDPWSPSYSPDDAQRLYEASAAMREHAWERASAFGDLFRLQPVEAA